MSEPLQTCSRCPHVARDGGAGLSVYYCKKTGLIVPQNTDQNGATFYRVPLSCPRPAEEVVKRRAGDKVSDAVREFVRHD